MKLEMVMADLVNEEPRGAARGALSIARPDTGRLQMAGALLRGSEALCL
jgi:hypothetical protein